MASCSGARAFFLNDDNPCSFSGERSASLLKNVYVSSHKERPMTPVQESVKQGIVVIVEDDCGNALTLELLLLSETTYEVRTYANAMELLESLEEIRQGKPVLFFLDYLLPEVDGLLLCEWLHALKEFREVPTVLITASIEERLKQEAERRGVVLLRKPLNMQTLLEVRRHHASKRKGFPCCP